MKTVLFNEYVDPKTELPKYEINHTVRVTLTYVHTQISINGG